MFRAIQILANIVAGVILTSVVSIVALETFYSVKEPQTPRDFFLYGSTGTELMPLAVFQVLPTLFPDQFQPGGVAAGDWIDQFGFVRGQPGVNEGLPSGVNVSWYRPKSGALSPIPFVGFNCAMCHSARIVGAGQADGPVIYGMANAALDLVAFGEAVKTSLLDEKRLTVAAVDSAYETVVHKKLGLIDKAVISSWLSTARAALNADLPMRGAPYSGADIRNSDLVRSGPGRNEPMKETVRFLIQQTPLPDGGASKIPSLYRQDRREWAQYDGSVHDPYLRNSLAALGVGASLVNLREPGILHTIQNTYDFVRTLEGPKYSDVVTGPDGAIAADSAERGRGVYMQYCSECHGWRPVHGKEWTTGKRQGDVIATSEVGTDSSRVTFRFYGDLRQLVFDFFPPGHPLKPRLEDMRTQPEGARGFITEPLESVFSRAPYLHNGSVPTLAQLINLVPRPKLFYRGASELDSREVGIVAPEKPDARHYFRFDTETYGNSNQGHDFPWSYHGAGWNEESLRDLLVYLKTL
jgi:hypothetical protein